MSATETTASALERNWEMVSNAVADMDDTAMSNQPNKESNSISWLLWHMTRVADRFIHTRLQDAPQLWIAKGWHQKFGMEPDPQDFGMGWSADRVAAWVSPSKDILLGYFEAANTATREYLNSLSAEALEQHIPFPTLPKTLSVGEALGILVWDNIVHGGQIAYLRGYHQGMGWHR